MFVFFYPSVGGLETFSDLRDYMYQFNQAVILVNPVEPLNKIFILTTFMTDIGRNDLGYIVENENKH